MMMSNTIKNILTLILTIATPITTPVVDAAQVATTVVIIAAAMIPLPQMIPISTIIHFLRPYNPFFIFSSSSAMLVKSSCRFTITLGLNSITEKTLYIQ